MIVSSLLLTLSVLILTPNQICNCIQDLILTHFPFQPKDYHREIWLNRGTFTHFSSSLRKTTLRLKKSIYTCKIHASELILELIFYEAQASASGSNDTRSAVQNACLLVPVTASEFYLELQIGIQVFLSIHK